MKFEDSRQTNSKKAEPLRAVRGDWCNLYSQVRGSSGDMSSAATWQIVSDGGVLFLGSKCVIDQSHMPGLGVSLVAVGILST